MTHKTFKQFQIRVGQWLALLIITALFITGFAAANAVNQSVGANDVPAKEQIVPLQDYQLEMTSTGADVILEDNTRIAIEVVYDADGDVESMAVPVDFEHEMLSDIAGQINRNNLATGEL